jgi:hypothetical protein
MPRRFVLLVVAVCVLVAAGSSTAARASRWPAAEEKAYMSNCKRTSHGQAAICLCTLRALERRYTDRQIATLYLKKPAQFTAVMRRTVLACRP